MSSKDDPNEWYGTRTVIPTTHPCGFCRDKSHDRCAHEIPWFEKLWVCSCTCNKTWKPQNVTVTKKTKESKNG